MKPYYEDGSVTIYHGDCGVVLRELLAGSVDVVITDPPYGMEYVSNRRKQSFGAIVGDDAVPVAWIDEITRLSKFRFSSGPGRARTAVFWFASDDSIAETQAALRLAGFALNRMLVWDKQAMTTGDLSDFGSKTEFIVFATKGNGSLNGSRDPNLISIPRVNPRSLVHPSQKPLALIEYLIVKASDADDLILDPFMGSGTTLLAAANLGRRAIGVEIEERFCEIAANRLRQETLGLSA